MNNIKRKEQEKQKDYDSKKQLKKLLDTVDCIYDETGEINATAMELDMSTVKVKKLLITSGKLEYEETKQIQRLMAYGKKMSEIQEETGLKKSSINSYLPYTKMPYKDSEVSANALRCELYRDRRKAVEEICDFDSLWKCIELFQNYAFYTIGGTKFEYIISGDELLVRGNKDKIRSSDILKAYEKLIESKKLLCEYDRVEDLSNVLGFYIYPLFNRFGLINISK